ncbi:MAG: PAS domain-containing sensor histidine kinase [Legionellales bacterium]|nr:PAS domain-containing sensor histidine kinase [Legionellales bacterium]
MNIYEKIFIKSPVALLLVNNERKICLANDAAEALFEYSKEVLLDAKIDILIPDSSKSIHPDYVTQYFKNPFPRRMGVGLDLHGKKKSGDTFPIEVGLNPLDDDGELLVMASIIDITERVKAEEKFRSAVEAAPNSMLMVNSKGVIVLVNEQTESLFGYPRSELLGKPIEMLVPDKVKEMHPTFVQYYIKNPTPRSMGAGRDLFGQKKNGEQFPVEIGLRPVFAREDTYIISSVIDLTEREAAKKRLIEKNEELQQFSYRTSHDLKQPLVNISHLSHFALEDIKNEQIDSAINNINKIHHSAKTLKRLLDDIFSLTKVDFIKEESVEFDFQQFLDTCLVELDIQLADSKVKFITNFNHTRSLIVQHTRLKQILNNLISNAVKYSHREKSQQFVKLNTFNDNHFFYIQVQDNGLGIPSDKIASVGNMFVRLHHNHCEGSGLGLYLVKTHIDRLNGEMSIDSAVNQGTTVTLKFMLPEKTVGK